MPSFESRNRSSTASSSEGLIARMSRSRTRSAEIGFENDTLKTFQFWPLVRITHSTP